MVLRDNADSLNLSFNFKIDGFNFMVFASSEIMKCFGCSAEGYLIPTCPEESAGQPAASAMEMNPRALFWNHRMTFQAVRAVRKVSIKTLKLDSFYKGLRVKVEDFSWESASPMTKKFGQNEKEVLTDQEIY